YHATQAAPVLDRTPETELLHALYRPIQRDPCHDLRVREVAGLATNLPDAVIGLLPHGFEVLHELELDVPCVGLRLRSAGARDVQHVHHFPVHIELELFARGVPDPGGRRTLISGKPRELPFGEPA